MSETGSGQNGHQAAIAFDNVVKAFSGRKVLDGISLTIGNGEALCILGRSGTGKSVTLKLMIGLLKPDDGSVAIQGTDVGSLDEDGLSGMRRKMGYMFQNAALFDSFTLHDNLALPLRRLAKNKSAESIEASIKEALEQVGLGKDGGKMPVALSGGMLKRAGLARALVLKPQILLVDEPNSGLDRITSNEINDLLLDVKTRCHTTMVIVTHDIEGAHRVGDRFAVLDKGRLIGLGTPEELAKTDNEIVKKLTSG